jgi:hypothetical protein
MSPTCWVTRPLGYTLSPNCDAACSFHSMMNPKTMKNPKAWMYSLTDRLMSWLTEHGRPAAVESRKERCYALQAEYRKESYAWDMVWA